MSCVLASAFSRSVEWSDFDELYSEQFDSVGESARICNNKKKKSAGMCHGGPHMCPCQLRPYCSQLYAPVLDFNQEIRRVRAFLLSLFSPSANSAQRKLDFKRDEVTTRHHQIVWEWQICHALRTPLQVPRSVSTLPTPSSSKSCPLKTGVAYGFF